QSITTSISTTDTVIESGTYLATNTSYELTQTDTSNSNSARTRNTLDGSDNVSTTVTGSTTLLATGGNSSGSYSVSSQTTRSSTWQQVGNDLSGDCAGTGSDSSTLVIQETASN